MAKKKIKKKAAQKVKTTYLIQNEDEEQVLSWWDAPKGSWTHNPLEATIYKTERAVEKEINILHDDGVDYHVMFSVPAAPILKKKKEWTENPPIKYLEKNEKKSKSSPTKIVPGTVLLDRTNPVHRPMLVINITEKNSVFTVSTDYPMHVEYNPLDHLEDEVKNGRIEVIWTPENKFS